jgi:hypothetical protein
MITNSSLLAAAIVGAILVACSSGSDSSGAGTKVKDQHGDTCTVPVHSSFTITCDQTPAPPSRRDAASRRTKGTKCTDGADSHGRCSKLGLTEQAFSKGRSIAEDDL